MHTTRFMSLGIAALVTLSACASNDTNVSADKLDAAGGTTGTTGTTEVEPINFLSYWTAPGDVETMHALIEVHKDKHPADTISIETGLPPAFGGPPPQTPPDVSMVFSSFLPELNTLQPLDEFLAAPSRADKVSKIYPALLPVAPNGSRYSIPIKVSRLNNLFYSKHVFRAHNLTPPTTLNELRTVCETLKAAGMTCFASAWVNLLFESVLIASLGVDGYISFRNGTIDEAKIRNAVDVFAELVEKYADLSFPTIDATFDALINQKIAMTFDGSFAMGPLEQLGQTAGVDFGVTSPPGNAGLFIYNADGLAISANAANPEGAARFLDSALSLEAVTAMSNVSRQLPVRTDVELPNADSETLGLMKEMKTATLMPDVSMSRSSVVTAFLQSSPRDKEPLVQSLLAK